MMCFDKEYIEQFKVMTPKQIENHIGLEKVRNVMDGCPVEYGIERIRKLVKKIQEEKNIAKNKAT